MYGHHVNMKFFKLLSDHRQLLIQKKTLLTKNIKNTKYNKIQTAAFVMNKDKK